MGKTHATSAVAFFLAVSAFAPMLTRQVLHSHNLWTLVAAAVATAGASLLPDLDNSSSTARNSLGPVGHICSEAVRALSVFIQTFLRTGKDDPEPNPHRGAAHTIPASLGVGALVWLVTNISGKVQLPLLGMTSWGKLSAIIVLFVLIHLAFSSLLKSFMKRMENSTPFGELVSFIFSFAVATVLIQQLPTGQNYWWLAVAAATGCVVHIVGDCFTTAGAPLLFPVSVFLHGKFWWTTRFTSIKAGGVVENVVFVPFFILVIVISSLRLFGFV